MYQCYTIDMNNGVFQAIRAVGAEFGMRLWWPSFYLALAVGVALVALLIWLVSINAWWWLLTLPIIIGLSVVAVLLTVFFLLIRYVRPQLSQSQKKQVQQFVDKLQLLQEISGTPKFIILFRTVRSIAAPRSDSYLSDLFNTKDLARNFSSIAKSFK